MPRQDVGSKNESGYAKQKREEKEDQSIQSQKNALLKHFRSNTSDLKQMANSSIYVPEEIPPENNNHSSLSSSPLHETEV
uniref:Uncharacterized protein n=1 Tax=Romanomermis culicivorax TaxID=13658 RepID=A0A915HLP5_ROMCU